MSRNVSFKQKLHKLPDCALILPATTYHYNNSLLHDFLILLFVIEHNDKRLLIQSESFYQKPIVRSSQIERKLAIFAAAEQIGRKRWWLSELYPAGEIWRKHRKTSICLGNNQFVWENNKFGTKYKRNSSLFLWGCANIGRDLYLSFCRLLGDN